MEKFSRTLRGYDPAEVNAFLDRIITQVEVIIEDNRNKDLKIEKLEKQLEESQNSSIQLSDFDHLPVDEETSSVEVEKLQKLEEENKHLNDKLETYKRMEDTLSKAIIMAQKTSEQIKINAHNESEILLDDARQNANRIVNEALIRAEKTEHEAQLLRRNINIFKRRIKDIVEAQLEVVSEFDKIEL